MCNSVGIFASTPAQDYPEHRLQFFNLLHAITKHCFATLFTMSPGQLKLVIDSIVWCALAQFLKVFWHAVESVCRNVHRSIPCPASVRLLL